MSLVPHCSSGRYRLKWYWSKSTKLGVNMLIDMVRIDNVMRVTTIRRIRPQGYNSSTWLKSYNLLKGYERKSQLFELVMTWPKSHSSSENSSKWYCRKSCDSSKTIWRDTIKEFQLFLKSFEKARILLLIENQERAYAFDWKFKRL